MHIADQHFAIYGLGDTGFASAQYLLAHGAHVTVFDHQKNPKHAEKLIKLAPRIAFYTEKFEAHYLQGVNHLLVSPGVALSQPEIINFRRNGGSIMSDIELFARIFKQDLSGHVIAISGSNGKSTVTELVGHLCRACQHHVVVAGNIGLPILDALLKSEQTQAMPDYWVLELSSFQMDLTENLDADAAVVLNIAEDHLDRYGDLLSYAASKSKLFNGQGVQVINWDDPLCCAMRRKNRLTRQFSLNRPTDYALSEAGYLMLTGEKTLHYSELPLQGLHNIANILAALALCEALHLPRLRLLESLKTFRGLSHRIEWVNQIAGVDYIDDSKGTNVAATEAALLSMTKKVILIAGGDGKKQDFAPLKKVLQKVARAVVLIGKDAQQIHQAIEGLNLPIKHCDTLEHATYMAASLAKSGDAVLLSPACASLDMFDNYMHRAQVFCDAVFRLKKAHKIC